MYYMQMSRAICDVTAKNNVVQYNDQNKLLLSDNLRLPGRRFGIIESHQHASKNRGKFLFRDG